MKTPLLDVEELRMLEVGRSGKFTEVAKLNTPLGIHLLLVPPLFIEGNSHSYLRSNFVFARVKVPY